MSAVGPTGFLEREEVSRPGNGETIMLDTLSNTRRYTARQPRRRRQRASARRHFRNGYRAAAARAFTAAELYLNKTAPTLAAAAIRCGSSLGYLQAALVLLKDQTASIDPVLVGDVPLLEAAHQVRRRQKAERITVEEMTTAWRSWSPGQRARFGREVGISDLWDHSIVPTISEERGELVAAE
jgi:hypothetical protein